MSEIILSIICLVELYVIIQLVNRLLIKSGVAPIELPKKEEEPQEPQTPTRKKIFSVQMPT